MGSEQVAFVVAPVAPTPPLVAPDVAPPAPVPPRAAVPPPARAPLAPPSRSPCSDSDFPPHANATSIATEPTKARTLEPPTRPACQERTGRARKGVVLRANAMAQFGRILLVFGVVLLVVGGAFILAEKLGLGRLPGDIVVEKKSFRLYVPIATSILVSLILTAILNLAFRK
jgi:uncharacterized membrane protein